MPTNVPNVFDEEGYWQCICSLPPLSNNLPRRTTFRPQVHNTGNKVLDGPGQRLGKEFDRNFLRAFFLAGPHF